MILEQLKEPFAPSDVSWRIGQAGKKANGEIWAKVLAYIDNRNIQDRLDAVCGPEHWANEFKPGPGGGVVCGISIEVAADKWVTKWDGAENSDIEPIKGGLSDSMKRAAVQWGIGRYLYDLGENWAEVYDDRKEGAHYANCKIKVKGQEEWAQFYWLPPRLPAFAVPKADPAEVARLNEVAAKANLKTADKLPPPEKVPTAYEAAKANIAIAVRDRDRAFLKSVEQKIYARHKEQVITEGDYLDLCGKIADAEMAIDAAADVEKAKGKREPATA